MSATKVYFINLDESVERRRALEAELAVTGLPFSRVPGVRGTALPEHLEPYFREPGGALPATMTPGEVGCCAAHLAACRQFLADADATAALILEDDAVVPAGFAETLDRLQAAVPPGWDMLRLSNTSKYACHAVAQTGRDTIVKYARVPTNARAYLISQAGAEKLLAPRVRAAAFDDDLRHPWRGNLQLYGVVPAPVGQRAVRSDIDSFGQRRFPRPTMAQRWRRADLAGWPDRIGYQIRWLGLSVWVKLTLANMADGLRRRLR